MDEATPKELFLRSLERCKQSRAFIPAFYDHFLKSSDAVKEKFRFTDFEKQEHMLLRSLELCARAADGDPEGLRELRDRAETHDRRHLDVDACFYSLWLNAIILTASDFDPEWDSEIERAWRTILGHVIDHMVLHY
jgi:hypothetical protein